MNIENLLSAVRKSFSARVLKLKFLAKFLGFLCFSPNWPACR